nr:MAG TPA_asm: hypothetical protein [Caudoviricetes sp.]
MLQSFLYLLDKLFVCLVQGQNKSSNKNIRASISNLNKQLIKYPYGFLGTLIITK